MQGVTQTQNGNVNVAADLTQGGSPSCLGQDLMEKFSDSTLENQLDVSGPSCLDLSQDEDACNANKRPNNDAENSAIKCPAPKIPKILVKIKKPQCKIVVMFDFPAL